MSKQKQAMRLYQAIERLSLQAGEDTDEAIDWLCGEHGGMFKLYEAYFSPKQEPVQFKCTVVDDLNPNGVPLKQWGNPQNTTKADIGIKGDA